MSVVDNKGARSYKTQVIGDSMAVTINFKWLLQLIIAVGMVVYGWWQLESRIQELERNMAIALEEIAVYEEERAVAEEKHIQMLENQMQEQNVWIEQELGINLNPFSWGKKGK
tara:strand:- start:448 stop:786 length:339 start_codon:yes stop_codon:yes gene_type:complete